MTIPETILCLQIGKCLFNFLPFLFSLEAYSPACVVSLLIVLLTDTTITGFLVCLWFGCWTFSLSTEMIFLQFLCWQNETYKSIALLLPWVCFSEQWSQSCINRSGGIPKTECTHYIQSRLLSLACWLIAAAYGKNIIPDLPKYPPVCDNWDWRCLYMYISGDKTFDWLLPAIGLVLGTTLFYNTVENRDSILNTILKEKRPLDELLIRFLPIIGTCISFYFLPPFMALNSWSVLALDGLSGIFRFQIDEPQLSTVNSVSEHTGKDSKKCIDTKTEDSRYDMISKS